MGVAYKGKVLGSHANKSMRLPRNKELDTRATKRLDRVFINIKGVFSPSQRGGYIFFSHFHRGLQPAEGG